MRRAGYCRKRLLAIAITNRIAGLNKREGEKMGQGFDLLCSNCGYKLIANLGTGFMYPREVEKTIEKIKSGKYGKHAREFFQENPEGTVDSSNVLLRCDHCGNLKVDKDLTLYKLKEGVTSPKYHIPNPYDYVEAEKIEHKCKKCGNNMSIIDMDDFYEKVCNGEITCPKCHGNLQMTGFLMWD